MSHATTVRGVLDISERGPVPQPAHTDRHRNKARKLAERMIRAQAREDMVEARRLARQLARMGIEAVRLQDKE